MAPKEQSATTAWTHDRIANSIDHSILSPTATLADLESGCRLAVECGVASICTVPHLLPRCVELLHGTRIIPCTVIGFPHGANSTPVKTAETQQAIAHGARELDMVVNISRVMSGDWNHVRYDIRAVIDCAHSADTKVKVIFENCYLTDAQKLQLCEICTELRADWVKTSTGFGTGGASPHDVMLMIDHVGPNVQVKASGGIRTLQDTLQYLQLGATRIGTSHTRAILDTLVKSFG